MVVHNVIVRMYCSIIIGWCTRTKCIQYDIHRNMFQDERFQAFSVDPLQQFCDSIRLMFTAVHVVVFHHCSVINNNGTHNVRTEQLVPCACSKIRTLIVKHNFCWNTPTKNHLSSLTPKIIVVSTAIFLIRSQFLPILQRCSRGDSREKIRT